MKLHLRVILIASFAFTCVNAAEITFVPVSSSGPHQIVPPNIIYLPQAQGGQRIVFEFFVSGWDPDGNGTPRIRTIQVATNVGSYGNANSSTGLAFPEVACSSHAQCRTEFGNQGGQCDNLFSICPADCCQAFMIDPTRPDFLAFNQPNVHAVDTIGARMGISSDQDAEFVDDGTKKYVGTLVLEVATGAVGEFTLTFRPFETFLQDERPYPNNEIPITSLPPAKVFIGVPPTTDYKIKPRYFTIENNNQSSENDPPSGYAIRLVSLHHPTRGTPSSPYQPVDFSPFEGEVRWLGPPIIYEMAAAYPQHTFLASRLQCEPYFQEDWPLGMLHVFGSEVIPDSVYEGRVLTASCTDFDTCNIYSALFTTGRWGDAIPPFEMDAPGTQPDISDIGGIVDRFENGFGAPTKAQTQLQPNVVDPTRKVNFSDISLAIDAFRGYAYPFTGPSPCP